MRRVKFKVVSIEDKGRRYSSFTKGSGRYSAFAQGKYELEYLVGTIVRSVEGTFGVSVFKTKRQAESFRSGRTFLKVIHVRPIGRGKTIRILSSNISELGLMDFYIKKEHNTTKGFRIAPPGTISYPAVEVLD